MASNQSASDKKAALQKQLEAIQAQMATIDQEVLHELKLKLSDARKVVQDLEAQVATITGSPVMGKKVRKARTPSMKDELLQPLILKALADNGKNGMNAKQIAGAINVDPNRVRKFTKDNPKVLNRTGSAAGTKFFLK